MTTKKYIHVNPLGEISYDISYNNVNDYKKNQETRKAQIEDSEKKNKSNLLQLGIWSFTASIFVLILLVLIRNIK